MKNKKGSISILVIYLLNVLLYISILIKVSLTTNIYYYQSINQEYDLFIIDNYISKSIYSQKDFISIDNINIKKQIKEKNNNLEYNIELMIKDKLIKYYVRYDLENKIITDFERY